MDEDRQALVDALDSALAWMSRWAVHAGNCKGGVQCSCGLLAITTEAEIALIKARSIEAAPGEDE